MSLLLVEFHLEGKHGPAVIVDGENGSEWKEKDEEVLASREKLPVRIIVIQDYQQSEDDISDTENDVDCHRDCVESFKFILVSVA